MSNKSKITTAPPNLWWVTQYTEDGKTRYWAYPIVAIEHYYCDHIKTSIPHGSEYSEIIYLMSDGTTSKEIVEKNSEGYVIFATSFKSAVDDLKYL